MNKLDIKEKLDNAIYKIYNLTTKKLFYFDNNKKEIEKNEKFNNKHLNERCFIVGTGPSLAQVDTTFLKDETTFGVNFLSKSSQLKKFTPDYYFLYDNIFYTTHTDYTKELINSMPNTTFFLRSNSIQSIKNMKLSNDKIYFHKSNLFQYNNFLKLDMTKNITAPFNVVLGCIQTAIYMGFKEIYLLGCDFNSFANLKVEHCYDQNNPVERNMNLGFELKFYSMVAYHHYALQEYALENDIKIINLTKNSLLDAYPREDIQFV